jgi:hypothetical protein
MLDPEQGVVMGKWKLQLSDMWMQLPIWGMGMQGAARLCGEEAGLERLDLMCRGKRANRVDYRESVALVFRENGGRDASRRD